jgi:predicted amidohydrolase
MRVGLIQLRSARTQSAALHEVERLVRQAADDGAQLVLTPEGTNFLEQEPAALQENVTTIARDEVVKNLRGLARDLSIEILIGSAFLRRGDGKIANRSILVGTNGAVLATYDKINMFDVDLPSGERWRESDIFTPGKQRVVAASVAGKLGLSICYDIRQADHYRKLALAGAEILTVPAAFTCSTGEAHWEILLRARAIETGSFVLAPAQGGTHEDGRSTWGRTMAVSPWGAVLGRLDHDDPDVLLVEIGLDEVAHIRHAIPALRYRDLTI